MSSDKQQTVNVERVINEAGDITHCLVTVGPAVFEALFTQSSSSLEDMVKDATEVTLSVEQLMAVTYASRSQMEREAERLKEVLKAMPFGTVAMVEAGLNFWLDTQSELKWVEWVNLGSDAPHTVFPGSIQCIGEIDTEELYAVAEHIRVWLRSPETEAVDAEWLCSVGARG
jgi:hypothetical protein